MDYPLGEHSGWTVSLTSAEKCEFVGIELYWGDKAAPTHAWSIPIADIQRLLDHQKGTDR